MKPQVTDSTNWNEEVLRRGGGFLQSWEWGEFQRAAGFDVARFRSDLGVAQLVRRPLPLRQEYWYCPRGPLGDGMLETLPGRSEFRRAAFLRFEPLVPPAASGVVKVRPVQPDRTLLLDLAKDPEELLAGMHEKTRYNIRLAERKGVRVYAASGKDPNAFAQFKGLLEETTGREGFHGHEAAHYGQMLETLGGGWGDAAGRTVARLVLAEHDGRVLAANLMLAFGDTVTYLHGASSRVRREVMAPHLLHWKMILEARAAGFSTYDFWGIAPEGDERHSWSGFTRFKRGFGGLIVDYPGTFDLPLDRFKYGVFSAVQKLRRRA